LTPHIVHELPLDVALSDSCEGMPLGAPETREVEALVRTSAGIQVEPVFPAAADSNSPEAVQLMPAPPRRSEQFARTLATAGNVADTTSPSVLQYTEPFEFAPEPAAADKVADTTSPSVLQYTEPFEFAPEPAAGNVADTTSPSVLQYTEPFEFAHEPAAAGNVADTASPSVLEYTEPFEFAPEPAAADKVADTASSSVLESAETVEIASALVTGSRSADTSTLPVEPKNEEVPQSWLAVCPKEKLPSPSLLAFYGLSEQPFQTSPDPEYLYLSQMHREALTSLSQGIQDLRGFMALIAEPGMGKTTLLNKLMEELRDSARTVFLFQTQCNSRELLRSLLSELGVQHAGMDAVAMHRALNEILFREMLDGRRFVLIVDEAHNLRASVLETIRLLSDFETNHRKLIQIVLAGQPQLVDTLMRPGLAQLRQRIAVLTNLEPLSATETARYVEHRLRAAGSSGEPIFTPEALALIAERSHGTPRSINNLCFNALRMGYADGTKTIDSKIVQTAAAKLDLEALRRPEPEQHATGAGLPPRPVPDLSPQLATALLAALTREGQPQQGNSNGAASRPGVTLTGKLTEKIRSRSWSKENECRIQVSLERQASSDIPVADRYYCCSFYVGEAQAASLQAGQLIKIRIELD